MAKQVDEALRHCGHCKKVVKKAKRYYRNGKYYCNFNCWRTSREKAESE